VRVLFWFLLLAAAAVAVALAARLTSGYALFVAPPYRVELSLNLLIVLLIGGFVVGYLVLRIVRRTLALPEEVRGHRRRQQHERIRAKQDAAMVALLEGRYGRARQHAEEALAIPRSSGLAALLGARAAIDGREFAAAEAMLARPDAQVKSLAVPRLMLEAELKLEQGQPHEALTVLQALRKEAGSHTAALRLELRAL
jgi:HemY protein